MTHFRTFQSERVADDNFKFDENDRKFSIWVGNTVGKGEIALNKKFPLFPLFCTVKCVSKTTCIKQNTA